MVREVRTFQGQRAGYISGRFDVEGKEGWMEAHITVREGVLYQLWFVVYGEDPAAYQPLFERVRDSLVFALAP